MSRVGIALALVALASLLSVLKSHFAPTCIGLFKQLLSKSEKRFVRTHWLQASRRSCEWGLIYLLVSVSFDSEDLKRLCALMPLGQKHAFWIRIGNLPIVQRNVLTTEPRPQIWHIKVWIIAIIKSGCKKRIHNQKNILNHSLIARQLWCWVPQWR